jgi:hypothetical protein
LKVHCRSDAVVEDRCETVSSQEICQELINWLCTFCKFHHHLGTW